MYEDLRERVCKANRELVTAGLVSLTFGNASGIDRAAGVLAIKPSGVPYDDLRPENMVIVGIDDGQVVDGKHRPSSDTPTHLVLYRRLAKVGGVVHTHSKFATAWAQAGRSIPCLGTTHADHFYGPIPVTRRLSRNEIQGDYERETGNVIVETLAAVGLDPLQMPAALVASHGPFAWGLDPADAVVTAVALEEIALIAFHTVALDPGQQGIEDWLLERHHSRKHGHAAYYGQPKDQL